MKIIIIFAFFAFELAFAARIRNDCLRACMLVYAPVCGYDTKNNTYETFTNDCFLAAANDCEKRNFVRKYAGPCKESTSECPIACTYDYNPVCARNGDIYKTFPNLCSVEMENKCSKNSFHYEVAYSGECHECFACKCVPDASVCALNYKTGSYQTFPCNCTLEKENKCPTDDTPRDNFEYKYDGDCLCSLDCPQKYDPICARSAKYGNYQTFSSMCSFQAEIQCNPNSADFVYKYDGACKCPVFCPMNYSPVCAINNANGNKVTFGNQCEMNAANECPEEEHGSKEYARYSFIRMGECEEFDCPKACTKEYDPVCACDVKGNCETFGNPCMLKSKNECEKRNYVIKNTGECKETYARKRRFIPIEEEPEEELDNPTPLPTTEEATEEILCNTSPESDDRK